MKENYEFYLKPGDIVKKVHLTEYEKRFDYFKDMLWLVIGLDLHPIYPYVKLLPLGDIPSREYKLDAYYNSTVNISDSWLNPTHAFKIIS